VITLIGALAFYLGYGSVLILLLISAFRSLGNAVHTPAVQSFLPELIPQDKLMKIQGINSGIQSSMMIVAPVLSAALLAQFPLFTLFFIDVVTAVLGISTLLLFVQHVPLKAPHVGKVEYFNDIKLGLDYIRQHSFLTPFFVFTALVLFFVAPMAFLTPLQTVFNFGPDEWRLSLIEVAFALGMMLGGFSVALWEGFRNRLHTMALALAVMGFASILLSLTLDFRLYLAAMFVVGLSLPYFNSPSYVMIQEKVDSEYLGRVFSVMGMISSSMMPIGMLVFGPMADYLDIDHIIIFSGVALMLITLGLLFNKNLIQAGMRKKEA
jgi:DHA3 family macrolide efflux protein-like MFS transporter